jgi:hypothetical protein
MAGSGSITLTNLAGYSLGVPNDEAGVNIQKITVKAMGEKVEVKDKLGHLIGRMDHGLKQEYSVEGYVSGTQGAMSAQIGAILVLASIVSLGGITSGACILDDVDITYETGTLAKATYKLTRYPDIPSTATQVTM